MYILILTLFLGSPGIPVQTEIVFQSEKACLEAKATANFSTEIPVLRASAKCEELKTT